MPEKSISKINPNWMMENYLINTIGPTLVMKHFGSKMNVDSHLNSNQSEYQYQYEEDECQYSIIATLSARVGSIGDNRLGGW